MGRNTYQIFLFLLFNDNMTLYIDMVPIFQITVLYSGIILLGDLNEFCICQKIKK